MSDTNQYDPAAQERMQNKLTGYINRKRSNNLAQIESIENESRLIYDYLVPTGMMDFHNVEENYNVNMVFNDDKGVRHDLKFHDNAVNQIATKFGVPTRYLRDLHNGKENWQKILAAEIMQYHASNADQSKLLVRAVGDQVRGVLSDSYKRLNSIVLYATFITAAESHGAVIADAHYNGLTGYLEVVRPDVIAIPTENNGIQFVCFGMQFRNSDFGKSSLDMRAFLFYPVCENGQISKSAMRNVHLGARLPDNLELSAETYKKDTETKASLMKDVIGSLLDPKKVYDYSVQIQEASKIEIDIEREIKSLPQLGVLEHEINSLTKVFMENNPDNNIGGANTLFKLTQGLSSVSRDSSSTRKRELDEITGKLFERVGVVLEK